MGKKILYNSTSVQTSSYCFRGCFEVNDQVNVNIMIWVCLESGIKQ